MSQQLRYDPGKLKAGKDGWLYYDGVRLAPDMETFLKNADVIFPPWISDDKPAYTVPPFPSAVTKQAPLTKHQTHPERSSSSEEERRSSSDSAKSQTSAPSGEGISRPMLNPTSSFAKALNVAADILAETDLHRIPATGTWNVKVTPGKMIGDQKSRPEKFFEWVAKTDQELRKLSQSTNKRRYLGIAPDEIVASGSLHCAGRCRPPDLNASLLKIFRFENFNDTPADVYQALQPALKLATRLMTDSRLLSFWATLLLGDREFDEGFQGVHFANDLERNIPQRLPHRVPVTPEAIKHTMSYLNRLGDHVNFSWNDLETNSEDSIIFGQKANFIEHGLWLPHNAGSGLSLEANGLNLGRWRTSRDTDPWEQESVLRLTRDFFTMAKRIAALQYPDIAMVLRFNFFFAVNICHELAHAFEQKCGHMWFDEQLEGGEVIDLSDPNWPNLRTERTQEALWLKNTVVEMGVAWERETFGGRIVPVNCRVDASLGIMVSDGESNWGHDQNLLMAGLPQGHMITMAFIEEIQQQSFWDRPSDPAEPHKLLHIPRTGAVTDFLIAASPSGWRSYLQQRDAARNEAQANASEASHADDDIPGPSKRIKLTSDQDQRKRKPLPGRGELIRHPGGKLFLQPRIDKAISKDEQNTEMLREEALATLAAEKATAAEEFRQRQQYVAPEPGQRDLHDQLHHEGSDSYLRSGSSDSESEMDLALKAPDKLTVEDKWWLLEEEVMISNNGLTSSSEFLALRTTDITQWIPWDLDPANPTSWQQDKLDGLLEKRKSHPCGQVFQDARKLKRTKEAENRRLLVLWSEMEELALLAGLSRIEFHRLRATGAPLPLGMDPDTSDKDPKWQELLHNMRATDAFMASPEYLQAVQTGQVNPIAQGAAAILSRLRSWKPPQTGSDAPGERDGSELPMKKITEYFKVREQKEENGKKTLSKTAQTFLDIAELTRDNDGEYRPSHSGSSSSSTNASSDENKPSDFELQDR